MATKAFIALENLGKTLVSRLKQGKSLEITMPLRSLSNVIYVKN